LAIAEDAMELKQSLGERWVRRIVNNRNFNPQWFPFVNWGLAIFLFALVIWNWEAEPKQDMWFGLFLICVFNGFIIWERNGWLHLVDGKDAEIRQLQESRDELRRQLDAMVIDQSSAGPDTRIRQ
jgi:hypothetical protein